MMANPALTNILHLGHTRVAVSFCRSGSLGRRGRRVLYSSTAIQCIRRVNEQLLLVVGGGAAGMYAAIRAKSLAPFLDVVVVEKGKLLSKVKVSGGGRCNVTNGRYVDKMALVEHYPRGNKELRGSFFSIHGPLDTMSWFNQHGVELKMEEDGRVFPVTDSSSTIVDCLLREAEKVGVVLQVGKVISHASFTKLGNFFLRIEKKTNIIEDVIADYLLVATGSSSQGCNLARQLGHAIIDQVPSLFSFKIEDARLTELSGVTFPKVRAKLEIDGFKSTPQLSQVGPMLVTHWGLSGPVVLRLSAWGARDLFQSHYKGTLIVDFIPDFNIEDAKHMLFSHREQFKKQKIANSFPPLFCTIKRFWRYILSRENFEGENPWASFSNNSLMSLAELLKRCSFKISGKGPFRDEFVTAGGIPLSEISLDTMQSRIRPHLFFAGEVLNVDGVTGGFNFQNAWTGGYIAGTKIAELAAEFHHRRESV